jgi:hypothetical protein
MGKQKGLKMEEQKSWQEEFNDKRLKTRGWYGCIAPDGWKKIVLECDEMLAFIDPDYEICQVKEKFATLRYYYDSKKTGIEREIMEAIVSSAERKSASTCEGCGKYGKFRDDTYYVVTMCDECNVARLAEIESRKKNG